MSHRADTRSARRPRHDDAASRAAAGDRSPAGHPRGPTAAILALQQAAGNRAVTRHLQRSFTRVPGGGWTVTFHVGTEIDVALAREAFARTTSGPLTDADLGELRTMALEFDHTIDDHERLFLAALLNAGNAAELHKAHPSGLDASATFVLNGSAISSADRDRVKDFGRETVETVETPMRIGAKLPGPKERIVALAGKRFAGAVKQLLAVAAADKVPLDRVEEAMLAAASDSTPGDRVMAGAAYVIALRAGMPAAGDLLGGAIKVDEVPADHIGGTAEYRSMGGKGKGDTVYLPSTFDVASIAFQGLLAHELNHAQNDKAATSFSSINRWREELAGYRTQGRYWLTELSKLKPAARPAEIAKVAAAANELSILAMLVEDRAANTVGWWALIEEINRTSVNGLSVAAFAAANNDTDADLEQRALRAISTAPTYASMSASTPVDGLRGESFLDE